MSARKITIDSFFNDQQEKNVYMNFKDNNNVVTRTRSDLWYILPIFGGIIGGIISWFAIRYDDPRKARNCLLLGIVLTAIPIILMIIPLLIFSSTTEFSIEPSNPYRPPIKFLDEFSI